MTTMVQQVTAFTCGSLSQAPALITRPGKEDDPKSLSRVDSVHRTSEDSPRKRFHITMEEPNFLCLDANRLVLPKGLAVAAPSPSATQKVILNCVRSGCVRKLSAQFHRDPSAFEFQNKHGWSLLHHAVRAPNTAVLEFLLDVRPTLRNCVDNAGQTALHHAISANRPVFVEALLMHGMDPNATDLFGRTPLYLAASEAARSGDDEIMQLLVCGGAAFDIARAEQFVAKHGGDEKMVNGWMAHAEGHTDQSEEKALPADKSSGS